MAAERRATANDINRLIEIRSLVLPATGVMAPCGRFSLTLILVAQALARAF